MKRDWAIGLLVGSATIFILNLLATAESAMPKELVILATTVLAGVMIAIVIAGLRK